MPVSASSSQAALMANTRDGNRPKPLFLPHLMRFSTRELDRAVSGWGVGGHHLVAEPLDGVERWWRISSIGTVAGVR
jgi:hypothetical protein